MNLKGTLPTLTNDDIDIQIILFRIVVGKSVFLLISVLDYSVFRIINL